MIMSKRENHLLDLKKYSITGRAMENYLLSNSNLPGKRGNIELGYSFADYIENNYCKNRSNIFKYCLTLINKNRKQAGKIGNEEFLPFCGILALGRIGKIDPMKKDKIIELLKAYAKDERWRIREAVAMAIQELMDVNPEETIKKLMKWAEEENYLVQRALVAGLAEPRLMRNRKIAEKSLDIHKRIIQKAGIEKDLKNPDYKVLIKGLCYTLSVIITGIEDEGFEYLGELAKSDDHIIRKIIRENLKKNRLKQLNNGKVLELKNSIDCC